MSLPVPDGHPVHLRALPIALWCSHYTQGTFSHDRSEQKRFAPGFAAVTGAYVACICTSDGEASLHSAQWTLRCGRTNDFGWVLRRDRAALGSDDDVPRSGWKRKEGAAAGVRDPDAVPPDAGLAAYDEPSDAEDAGVQKPLDLATFHPDDAVMVELDSGDANAESMFVLPNEHHHIFWCYEEAHFALFLDAYDADPGAALRTFKVPVYEVAPFCCTAPVDMLRELSPREQAFVARQLSSGLEGYHAGLPALDGMSAAIFDATPSELRTLYLCEWLQWCCLHAVHDDPHWPYLLALRSVIRAAVSGAPIPDLAERLPGGDKGQRAGLLRAYLHDLASEGVEDRIAAQAVVDVHGESKLHPHWRDVAEIFRNRYGLNHPAAYAQDKAADGTLHAPRDLEGFRFSANERAALVAYYDMYVLGFRHAADAPALDAHWEQIQLSLDWLRQRQTKLLATLDHAQLLRALGLYVSPRNSAQKDELANRYHYLCAALQVPFWEEARTQLATQSAWDAHRPFVKWMGDVSGRLGKLFKQLLEEYVPKYRDLRAQSVERLVQYLYRYHLSLNGRAIEATLPMHNVVVRLEPDPANGRALAKLFRSGKETVLLELELLTSVASAPDREAHAPLGPTDPGIRFKRFRHALSANKVRVFKATEKVLHVPNQDDAALASFPKALATCAALFKTSEAVHDLLQELRNTELRDRDVSFYLRVAEKSMHAVDSNVALVAPLFERASGRSAGAAQLFVQGAKGLRKVAGFADSVRDVVSGVTTLSTFLGSTDTDLAGYLDRGEGLPALLETVKGIVQVAKGATGVQAVVIGAGTTVATMSAGTWLALGMVAVPMLDVLIYLDTGGPSPVEDFVENVRQSRSAQFALRDGVIPMPNDESPAKGRARSAGLLTRKLSTVNHVLKLSGAS